jgi:gliding motility-associated-like protein
LKHEKKVLRIKYGNYQYNEKDKTDERNNIIKNYINIKDKALEKLNEINNMLIETSDFLKENEDIESKYKDNEKEINKTNTSWDGTFNNQTLPSADYWFVLEATNGKNIKGHFSLKR